MFFHKNGHKVRAARNRVVDVGWVLQIEQASFIWDAPRPFKHSEPPPEHSKSVAFCPAVIDHETRLFEVLCPFDLRLRMNIDEKGEANLIDLAGSRSSMDPRALAQITIVAGRKEWRHPNRPIFQIRTPYTFVSDEAVHMTQLPPLLHYREPRWPGLVIGGRVPIDVWPRSLNWAFEWYDLEKELTLVRGEPWFYVRFETPDAKGHARLIEAQMTPQLRTYLSGINGVVKYVNRSFSLFSIAQRRRPERLLVQRKVQGKADQTQDHL
jgi:hypothetical protein